MTAEVALDAVIKASPCVLHASVPEYPRIPHLDCSQRAWLCAPCTAQRPQLFPAVWAPRKRVAEVVGLGLSQAEAAQAVGVQTSAPHGCAR